MREKRENKGKKKTFDLKKILNRLFIVIGIGVLGNLAFSYYYTDRDKFARLVEFSPWFFALAVVFALLPWFWHCIRLLIWARFLKQKISFRDIFRIVIATDLGAAVTPTVVGGAPIKIGMLVQKGFSAGAATTLIALASVEDIIFYALIIPFSLTVTKSWDSPLLHTIVSKISGNWETIILISLGVILSVFLLNKLARSFFKGRFSGTSIIHRIKGKIEHTWTDFKSVAGLIWSKGRWYFLLSMIALSIQWLCRFGILIALVLSLGLEADLLKLFLLQWMIFVAMMFVPTPGATGGAEAAFFYIFGPMIPKTAIGVVMFGWRFLAYYFIMLTAVFLLYLTGKRGN